MNSVVRQHFCLRYKHSFDGKVYGIGDGDKYVDPAKDYYLSLTIKRQFGYIWPEEVMMDEERHPVTDFSDMSVYIDGELRKDVYIQYNLAMEMLLVMITEVVLETVVEIMVPETTRTNG